MIPDDATAEAWFAKARWPNWIACPHCGSVNVQSGAKHKTMPYRCRDCRKRFSAKVGTALEGSNLGFQSWVIGIYLLATGLKGISSMKLRRDLNISQKSAWHLAHRLRKAWGEDGSLFAGPVEADECYVGGKRRNMPLAKRKELDGRGPVGKVAVAGIKDRPTKLVRAKVVSNTDSETLQGFLRDSVSAGAKVYTDDAPVYDNMPDFEHESVKHSVAEYVRGMAHTNGVESFWSMLKRAHKGTFHNLSAKHLQRYVNEFVGRHNQRESDTLDQMQAMVRGMDQKRLKYADLVA